MSKKENMLYENISFIIISIIGIEACISCMRLGNISKSWLQKKNPKYESNAVLY